MDALKVPIIDNGTRFLEYLGISVLFCDIVMVQTLTGNSAGQLVAAGVGLTHARPSAAVRAHSILDAIVQGHSASQIAAVPPSRVAQYACGYK